MHLLTVLKVVGMLLMVLGGAQLVPMAASLLYGIPPPGVFVSRLFWLVTATRPGGGRPPPNYAPVRMDIIFPLIRQHFLALQR